MQVKQLTSDVIIGIYFLRGAILEHIPTDQTIKFQRTLIQNGADMTVAAPDYTPVIALVLENDNQSPDTLHLLLQAFPNALKRQEACHDRQTGSHKWTPLSCCVEHYTQYPSLIKLQKIFLLVQYGSDPEICFDQGNFLNRFFSSCPIIDRSWPTELQDAIRFCCIFRAAMLTAPTRENLMKLQRQHPQGFSYLARGVIEGTLFFENDKIRQTETLKPILASLLEDDLSPDPAPFHYL